MTSRPNKVEPRPAPRLYLVTPLIADAAAFSATLTAALAAGDVAAVLLRLADADERAQINCAKTLASLVQAKDVALLLEWPRRSGGEVRRRWCACHRSGGIHGSCRETQTGTHCRPPAG